VLSYRAGLLRAIDEIRRNALDANAEVETIGELAGVGGHDADLGSETFERERDMGLLRDFADQLVEVTAALRRLDDGTYGTCVGCGGDVEPRRLAALPAASRCLHCQEQQEAAYVRDADVARGSSTPDAAPSHAGDGRDWRDWLEDDFDDFDDLDDLDDLDDADGVGAAPEERAIHVLHRR